jgi:FkbM family methyltransferase
MLFDLKSLIKKYNMNIKNIIHVGGHFGQEIKLYKDINPEYVIDIFEPHPFTFNILKQNTNNFKNINYHNIALGSEKKIIPMFVENANQGQSNSLLKPKLHTEQYPHIQFEHMVDVNVETMDSFCFDISYNFISIDVQGYELEVLKGAKKTLNNIQYIIAEINNKELYEGCCMVEELDDFLQNYGFYRVETNWEGGTWGDGFYLKS